MFNFNVKDGSLPGGQFYLSVPVSMPEMYVFRSIADVRSVTCGHCRRKHADVASLVLRSRPPVRHSFTCAAVCDPSAAGR